MPEQADSRTGGSIKSAPGAAVGAVSDAKAKIFISYSRKDEEFAHELMIGLEFAGFEPIVDKHDIAAGEEWEARLGRLIDSADTVVFLISPDSVASHRCVWEVEHSEALHKRLLPVVWRAVDEDGVPERLRRLNYIYFDKRHSFAPSLATLAAALRTDLSWVREHTRLLSRAHEWAMAGRAENRLLGGQDILDAKIWLARAPSEGIKPTELHRDFIQASDQAESDRRSAERKRADALLKAVRRTRVALAGALMLAFLSAAAGLVAYREQRRADAISKKLEAKVAELEASRVRVNLLETAQAKVNDILDAKRTATLGLTEGERQTFAEFKKLAGPDLEQRLENLGEGKGIQFKRLQQIVAIGKSVGSVNSSGQHRGTGFLVRGSDLSGLLGDEVLLLTTASVMAASVSLQETVFELEAETETGSTYKMAEMVWHSPESQLNAALIRLNGLPSSAVPLSILAHGTSEEILKILEGKELDIIKRPSDKISGISTLWMGSIVLADVGWKEPGDHNNSYIQYHTPELAEDGAVVIEPTEGRVIAIQQRQQPQAGLPALSGKPGQVIASEAISMPTIAAAVDRALREKKR